MKKPPQLLISDRLIGFVDKTLGGSGEDKWSLIKALFLYNKDGTTLMSDNPAICAAFAYGQREIDDARDTRGRLSSVRSKSGSAGARARWSELEKKPSQPRDGKQGRARAKTIVHGVQDSYPEEFAAWNEWRNLYPAARRVAAGPEILEFIRLKGLVARKDEISQKLLNFQQKDHDWRRGFVPRMTKFFKEERYENDPVPTPIPEERVVKTTYLNQRGYDAPEDYAKGEDTPF